MKKKKRRGRIGGERAESRNKDNDIKMLQIKQNRNTVWEEITPRVRVGMLCPGISNSTLQMKKLRQEESSYGPRTLTRSLTGCIAILPQDWG